MVITGAYGHKVMSDDDELIKQMEHATHITTSVGSPGATPVDFFPICEQLRNVFCFMLNVLVQYLPLWLPGTRLLRLLKEGRTYIKQALESPLSVVRKEMVGSKKFDTNLLVTKQNRKLVLQGHRSSRVYLRITMKTRKIIN